MSGGLPAITGPELAKLIEGDGWVYQRESTHGWSYTKTVAAQVMITTIPRKKNRSLPSGVLSAILGPKQTNLGRQGLLRLLKQ